MTTSLLARRDRPAPAGAVPSFQFFTGTHCACWLWDGTIGYPLFVSHRRLTHYLASTSRATGRPKPLKAATVPAWAVDSGGFTELSIYGTWLTGPLEYCAAVA